MSKLGAQWTLVSRRIVVDPLSPFYADLFMRLRCRRRAKEPVAAGCHENVVPKPKSGKHLLMRLGTLGRGVKASIETTW